MENVKMTKKEIFGMIANIEEIKSNEIFANFITHELELLDRKSTTKKSAFDKEENIALLNKVMDILQGTEEAMTCKDIHVQVPELAEAKSTSKITSLLNKLQNDGKVTREVVKGRALFTAVEVEV